MEIRRICRSTKLWPDVIADLIAGYAQHSNIDKFDILVRGDYKYCDHVAVFRMNSIQYIDGALYAATITDTNGKRWTYNIMRDNLVRSIECGRWVSSAFDDPMSPRDAYALREWLASAPTE